MRNPRYSAKNFSPQMAMVEISRRVLEGTMNQTSHIIRSRFNERDFGRPNTRYTETSRSELNDFG